ncbi:MAG: hypothetical protein IKK11_00530, partial [Oscillospiraceae bacterium]|nr:hypothetical protein [Oscillospiraceae bacterium]
MKRIWARYIAFVLMLSMMLPMVPSFVFAVGSGSLTPNSSQPMVYDFTGVDEINGTSLPLSGCAATESQYNAGSLNWTYVKRDSTQSNVMVGGTSANGQTVRAWRGLRLNSKKTNGWIALKIKSAATGKYQLQFGYQTYKGHSETDVYILAGTTTDVAAALTNAQKLGAINANSNTSAYQDASVTFENTYDFTAGGEYLLVFHYPNGGNANLYTTVTNLNLIPYEGDQENTTAPQETTAPVATTAPEETTTPVLPQKPGQRNEVVYNFDLGETDLKLSGETFATKALGTASIGAIDDYYDNYYLDWKYSGISPDLKVAANFGGQFADRNYKWKGLRLYAKDVANTEMKDPFYAAFTIRSPGTGKYYLTFDYQTHRYGAGKGSVYVLPGNTTDIAAAIAAGEALGSISY